MRFLADACFSGRLFRAMRDAGFDIEQSRDQCRAGSDMQILSLAFAQGRVLLTEDNDFGDLTVRLGLPTHGVVRVDLKLLDQSAQIARLLKALAELSTNTETVPVTIEPTRTRVRRLDQSRSS